VASVAKSGSPPVKCNRAGASPNAPARRDIPSLGGLRGAAGPKTGSSAGNPWRPFRGWARVPPKVARLRRLGGPSLGRSRLALSLIGAAPPSLQRGWTSVPPRPPGA
jgi:hypothetical protein